MCRFIRSDLVVLLTPSSETTSTYLMCSYSYIPGKHFKRPMTQCSFSLYDKPNKEIERKHEKNKNIM